MSTKPKSIGFGWGSTTNTKVSIATSTTKLRDAANRTLLILTNTSTNDVWLAFGANAVASEGCLLSKNGGVIILGKSAMYKGQINAIAISASVDVAVVEVIE